MTELKITQADRDTAIQTLNAAERQRSFGGNGTVLSQVCQIIAAHRIAAEEGKAELVGVLERIEGTTMSMYFKPADMVQDIKRMVAAALARVRGEG